jgi:hypothetical protein
MTTIEERLTEIVEHAIDSYEIADTVKALTELVNESYSAGYSFAKNEAGLIEEVSTALAAD